LSALEDVALQRATLDETDHRPWPLPERRWLMGQTWTDLLFAHWAVEPEALARVVPAELPLDTHDGRAWIGVTPFRVRGLRQQGLPPLPLVSRFPELNVRTYVTLDAKPGIYFLSLDAGSRLAVAAARRAYRLPYFRARMSVRAGESVAYESRRISRDGPPASFLGEYGPVEREELADAPLARWLAERYCLYTLDEERRPLRADIHHPPWPLEPAWADISHNSMARPYGLDLPGRPLLHFSRRQDTLIWALQPV
jgi:uncharacterized protein YqjF (DUF2071 family)